MLCGFNIFLILYLKIKSIHINKSKYIRNVNYRDTINIMYKIFIMGHVNLYQWYSIPYTH